MHVANQCLVVGQRGVAALDPPHPVVVHQEQVISPGRARDVHVLPQVDVAPGSNHHETAVAPGRETVRRVPVHPRKAGRAFRPQQYFPVVLEPGVIGIRAICDRRRNHVRVGRAGQVEKLIDLVRGDVTEDASSARAFKEPGWAQMAVDPVRSEAREVHDLADRAGLNQLVDPGHCPNLEAF